jgi:hypothetical protein
MVHPCSQFRALEKQQKRERESRRQMKAACRRAAMYYAGPDRSASCAASRVLSALCHETVTQRAAGAARVKFKPHAAAA